VMPLIGWLVGTQLEQYITAIDHWVAFGLLCLVGAKMLWEAFAKNEADDDDSLRVRELLVLAVATSVDALAVGISFAFLSVDIVPAVLLIGAITTVLTFAGVLLGTARACASRSPLRSRVALFSS